MSYIAEETAENYRFLCKDLENCKEWEWKIKTMLQSLSRSDPAFVQSMLDKYGYGLEETIRESTVEDLYRLLKELQNRSLLPAILFRLNPGVCQEKFTQLVHYLKEEESRVYPYYYDDLNFLKEFYDSLAEEDKELENITIPDNIGSPHLYIEDRKKKLRSAKLAEYQKKGVDHFKSRILYNKNRIEENGDDEILQKQIKYYEKQIFKIRRQVEVVSINVYKPHPDFTFLEEHVSTEHIIDYRRQLMDYLREENELLLLQLHQVQEELEHYFLLSQKAVPAELPARHCLVDFRQRLDGNN